jgi:hypothetical protein
MSGLPDSFGVILLVFSLILFLAPYFSGTDFGLFKIPTVNESAKKLLRIIGPVLFVSCILSFVPIFSEKKQTTLTTSAQPTASAQVTPSPNPDHSPKASISPSSNPSPTLQPTPAANIDSEPRLITDQSTGTDKSVNFYFDLRDDEIIVGDAFRFNDKDNNGKGCVVFLIRGPGQFNFTLTGGHWRRFENVASRAQAESLLDKDMKDMIGLYAWCTNNVLLIRLPKT